MIDERIVAELQDILRTYSNVQEVPPHKRNSLDDLVWRAFVGRPQPVVFMGGKETNSLFYVTGNIASPTPPAFTTNLTLLADLIKTVLPQSRLTVSELRKSYRSYECFLTFDMDDFSGPQGRVVDYDADITIGVLRVLVKAVCEGWTAHTAPQRR